MDDLVQGSTAKVMGEGARGRPGGGSSVRRELGLAWVHLAVLWAFAFAQPLFDVLEDSPEFFVARGNTSADIIVLALALTLVAPTVMVLCEAALFSLPAVRRALHLTFVGLLVAAIVLQLLGDVDVSGVVLMVVSLAVGAGARWPMPARGWCRPC